MTDHRHSARLTRAHRSARHCVGLSRPWVWILALAGCSATTGWEAGREPGVEPGPQGAVDGADDGGGSGGARDSAGGDSAAAAPCTTTLQYGDAWIHDGTAHPSDTDVAEGLVTWDGVCTPDADGNSSASLSNGWVPYFSGPSACVIGLDSPSSCGEVVSACQTLVSYGASWAAPADHPARWDLVDGRVFPISDCLSDGSLSHQTLSNGWEPHFSGECALSFRYEGCGGLYQNPVVPRDCPDPGVVRDGERFVMTCTGAGSDGGVFPLLVSTDLRDWEDSGSLLTAPPAWSTGDHWAPELRRVGEVWRAVYTARASDGQLSIGTATAPDPLGPWTDSGAPLLHDAGVGLIDPSIFVDDDGSPWLLWKEDGNAVGRPTPIFIAPLAADGGALAGAPTVLLTNDQPWEGSVVEGPWMLRHEGQVYLFYSGNGYASSAYAMGVARAASPLGPFEKAASPILSSTATWAGPGHGSVLEGPGGDTVVVYHAWEGAHVGGAPGRVVLLDSLQWVDGWPVAGGAPSASSRPAP
jgi:arabinan endo-1,5-alpha-L-arabinosidase